MSRNENSAPQVVPLAATPDCYTGAVREVGQHTGLQRRGARYFLRVRVPATAAADHRQARGHQGARHLRVPGRRRAAAPGTGEVHADLFKAATPPRVSEGRRAARPEPEPSTEAILAAVQDWLATAERSALASPLPDGQAEVVLESVREEAAHFGAPGAEQDASRPGRSPARSCDRPATAARTGRPRSGRPCAWPPRPAPSTRCGRRPASSAAPRRRSTRSSRPRRPPAPRPRPAR